MSLVPSLYLPPGDGGSGRLPNQRRRRNARSLRVWLPNSAVAMIVSTATTSMTAMASPRRGRSIPMPTGVPNEAAAGAQRLPGSRAQSGELADVTDRSMPVIKMGLSRAGTDREFVAGHARAPLQGSTPVFNSGRLRRGSLRAGPFPCAPLVVLIGLCNHWAEAMASDILRCSTQSQRWLRGHAGTDR